MGGVPCGEGGTSCRQERRCEESVGEESSGEGGEEDFASKEIGGEEIWTEEDGPDCCTGRNGNRCSVNRWRPGLIRASANQFPAIGVGVLRRRSSQSARNSNPGSEHGCCGRRHRYRRKCKPHSAGVSLLSARRLERRCRQFTHCIQEESTLKWFCENRHRF